MAFALVTHVDLSEESILAELMAGSRNRGTQ